MEKHNVLAFLADYSAVPDARIAVIAIYYY
jgi:hypothetical protein